MDYEKAVEGMKTEYPTGEELDSFLSYKRDMKNSDNSDILVIKCNYNLKTDKYKEVYDEFYRQYLKGVVLLKPGFDFAFVPKDIAVAFDWPDIISKEELEAGIGLKKKKKEEEE